MFSKAGHKTNEWFHWICCQETFKTKWLFHCKRHFEPRFIIRYYVYPQLNGSSFTCSRESPALDTAFVSTWKYLSSPLPPTRKALEERRAKAAARYEKRLNDWMDSDSVKGFDDFAANVSENSSSLQSEWVIVNTNIYILPNLFCFEIIFSPPSDSPAFMI